MPSTQYWYADLFSTWSLGARASATVPSRPFGVPMVRAADYPKMYGGFIHPWSTEDDLYFTMSEWDSYNVYLMHAKLN